MVKTKTNNIFILIGLLFFLVAYFIINHRDKEIERKGIKTVGYINYTGINLQYGNKYCKYTYYVNGVSCKGVKSYYESEYDVKEGDYYEVIYNPHKSDNSDVNLKNRISSDSVCIYFEKECPFEMIILHSYP